MVTGYLLEGFQMFGLLDLLQIQVLFNTVIDLTEIMTIIHMIYALQMVVTLEHVLEILKLSLHTVYSLFRTVLKTGLSGNVDPPSTTMVWPVI